MVDKKPSIHVTHKDLFDALQTLGILLHDNKKSELIKLLAHKQLNRFFVLAPTASSAAKINGKKLTDKAAQLSFNMLIKLRASKGIMMRHINIGQPGWVDVVEAANSADLFVQRFDIDDRAAGHIRFYKLAIEILGDNFNIKSIANQYEKICNKFQEELDIFQCKDLETVKKLITVYVSLSKLNTKTADLVKEKYKICFVRCYNEAIELEVDPIQYLKIQFESLQWANINPTPKQLYGELAVERYLKTKQKENNSRIPVTDKQKIYSKLLKNDHSPE